MITIGSHFLPAHLLWLSQVTAHMHRAVVVGSDKQY